MATTSLGSLLLTARQSLQTGEPERAVDLARQALNIEPASILAFFVLGSAHAALSAHADAAAAFRRVVQLTAGSRPDTQRHHLHVAAAQNMLLESKHALPSSWIPTLNDARRLATVQQSIQAAVAQFSSPPRVLVCGGMGLEAVMAAQAGAAAVSILCLGNPLAASLSAELAAASGCGDRVVAAASTAELRQGLGSAAAHHSNSTLLVLADALTCSINWRQLAEQVAAVAPLLGTEVAVLPHEVHMRACLVHCAPAVVLNEVDACALSEVTGGLHFEAANQALPRSSRSVCLPGYQHTALTAATTLLAVRMAALLPSTLVAAGGSFPAGAPEAHGATMQLQVSAAGPADALCWWYEQLLLPGGAEGAAGNAAGGCLRLSADPDSCMRQEAALQPHVWQHLEFLDHSWLAAGQQVEVKVCCCLPPQSTAAAEAAVAAAATGLQSLGLAAASSAAPEAPPMPGWAVSPQFNVLLAGSSGGGGVQARKMQLAVPQPSVAAAMPPYHASMLNDSRRTSAYRDGIAGSLQQAAGREKGRQAPEGHAAGEPPLVLDIGSGSGLLCLLACQAGAQHVVGCERVPELNALAGELLHANGMADRVSLVPKLSRQLAVATATAGGGTADMPRHASVLLHEIFGTDPFSEGVMPTLVHAKQQLLQPGATLAPCKLHIITAVATSTSLHRLLRPPATVCGGRICTAALRELAPQKVDCQAGQVSDLFLLTEPCCVLSVDFEAAELELEGSSTVLLECLPQPWPLAAWAAAMQAASDSTPAAGPPSNADENSQVGRHELAPGTHGAGLYALSWFEIEFAGGVTGSSAPHLQHSEHWQQVVQPLEGNVADAVLRSLQRPGAITCGDGAASEVEALVLTAGWTVDRLWFKLEGIAAAGSSSDENES
ncbi:Protein arginine N-methyltransferase 7 [Chlorella vulgaris]